MFGWRARVGLIVPATNAVNAPEWRDHLPEGVSLHTARMSQPPGADIAALDEMVTNYEGAAERLGQAEVDVVAFGCTTGSLFKGYGYETEIETTMQEAADVPAVATSGSIQRAFEALGVESLAVVTPYIEELNEKEREFLTDAGFTVTQIDGLGIEEAIDIGKRPADESYRHARGLEPIDADALFISCTAYRTFEHIRYLEHDLDVPVVSSNQATLWDTLRTVGVDYSDIELGRLFEE